MIDTHLSFRTIDFIDTTVDALEKLEPARYMFAHIDALDAFNELLAVRSSSEAARLRRRIAKIRSEYESVLMMD